MPEDKKGMAIDACMNGTIRSARKSLMLSFPKRALGFVIVVLQALVLFFVLIFSFNSTHMHCMYRKNCIVIIVLLLIFSELFKMTACLTRAIFLSLNRSGSLIGI